MTRRGTRQAHRTYSSTICHGLVWYSSHSGTLLGAVAYHDGRFWTRKHANSLLRALETCCVHVKK
jgi:hypothetical protein